jgi:hypothetical protein
MNPFATHIPVLLACLRRTTGPVLEFGSGWFSTPILSAFAVGRLVRTVEADPRWFPLIVPVGAHQPATKHDHQLVFVPDYQQAPIDDHFWSVALIDHEPPQRRGIDVARLHGKCQLLIAHDSQHDAYGYGPAFERFQYRFTFDRLVPWTTVVSDTDPLDWLDETLRPLW